MKILFLSTIIILGLTIRIIYISLPPLTVDGDTAVLALMAKHVSELKEFPIYMWLAHYTGTLSCYIGAILFRIFGVSSFVYKFTIVIFSIPYIFLNLFAAKRVFGYSGSLISLFLILFPPFYILHWSLFGAVYPDTLVFGSLVITLLFVYADGNHQKILFFPLLGFSLGMGLWLTPFIMPFLLTTITAFLIKDRRIFFSTKFIFFVSGFLIGYFPAIIYNLQYPSASLYRMGGRILNLNRIVISSPDLAKIVVERILWRISIIPGLLKGIPYMFSSLVGVINLIIFVISVLWVCKKELFEFLKNRNITHMNILIIYIFWFTLFYLLLEGKPRYTFPLYIVLPIFVGKFLFDIKIKSVSLLILGVLLFYNCYDIGQSLLNQSIKMPNYPQLAEWLLSKKMLYGYSDYWTSYPVIFESKEKVLISPTLFHPTFFDRRQEYTSRVRDAENTVIIFHKGSHYRSIVDTEKRLRELGVQYRQEVLEEFVIYYDFSRRIYPEELKISIEQQH